MRMSLTAYFPFVFVQNRSAADPDLSGILSVCERHPIHHHRYADPSVWPIEGESSQQNCTPSRSQTVEQNLIGWRKLSFCFGSTSTRAVASWSWEPERCRSSVWRPSLPETWVRTRSWEQTCLSWGRFSCRRCLSVQLWPPAVCSWWFTTFPSSEPTLRPNCSPNSSASSDTSTTSLR